jgi:hypothetical protein
VKTWLIVFSAVIAAGLVLLAIFMSLSGMSAEHERTLAAWSLSHAQFAEQVANELGRPVSRGASDSLRQLRERGEQLKASAPAGADVLPLSRALSSLQQRETHLQTIDWKQADEWDAKVAAVVNHLRRVMDDHTLRLDVKRYEVGFVRSRFSDLAESPPVGANLQQLGEGIEELKRAHQTLNQ